jgi:hypothetical protein
MARPSPVVPPATTATLPDKSNKVLRIEEIFSRIRPQDEKIEAAIDFRRPIRKEMRQISANLFATRIIA